jgi:hypothetical protein
LEIEVPGLFEGEGEVMVGKCDCSLCRLDREIADLREENERLRNDSERLRNRITSMHDVIDFEKVLNERLRANAIVWHKWPEEAPKTNGWKIGCFEIPGAKYWDKAYFRAPDHWEHDGRYYDPFLWAEMPEGE